MARLKYLFCLVCVCIITSTACADQSINSGTTAGPDSSGSGNITVASGGTLELTGQTIGSGETYNYSNINVNGTGNGGIGAINSSSGTNVINASVTLQSASTINTDVDLTISGGLAGSYALTKTGTGTLSVVSNTIAPTNFVINGGTLALTTGAATYSGGTSKTISGSGTVSISSSGKLDFQSGFVTDFSGTLKLGTNVRVWQNASISSANYIVYVSSDAAFAVGGTGTVITGGTYYIAGDGYSTETTGALRVEGTLEKATVNLTADATVGSSATPSSTFRIIKGSTINADANTLTIKNLNLQDSTDSTKTTINSSGTVTFTGTNTLSGNTTIDSSGTVTFTGISTIGSAVTLKNTAGDYVLVDSSGTTTYNVTANHDETDVVLGVSTGTLTLTPTADSVVKFGSLGTLDLTKRTVNDGYATILGGTIQNTGTSTVEIQVGALGLSETGEVPGNVMTSGTLYATFGGTIQEGTGAGKISLTKVGSGRQIFASSGLSYTGATKVEAGELYLYNSSFTSSSGIDLAAGTKFTVYEAKESGDITFGSTTTTAMNISGSGTLLFAGDGQVSSIGGRSNINIRDIDTSSFTGKVIVDGTRIMVNVNAPATQNHPITLDVQPNSTFYVYGRNNEVNVWVNATIAGNGIAESNGNRLGALRVQGEVESAGDTPAHLYGSVKLSADASVSAYDSTHVAGIYANSFDVNGKTLTFGAVDQNGAMVSNSGIIHLSGPVTSTEPGYDVTGHKFTGVVEMRANITLVDPDTPSDVYNGSQATWHINSNGSTATGTAMTITTSATTIKLGSLSGDGKLVSAQAANGTDRNITLEIGGTNFDNPYAFTGTFVEAANNIVSINKVGLGTQNFDFSGTDSQIYSGTTAVSEGRLNIQGTLKNCLMLEGGEYSAGSATGVIGKTSIIDSESLIGTANALLLGAENLETNCNVIFDVMATTPTVAEAINALSDLIETDKNAAIGTSGGFTISLNELTGFDNATEYKTPIIAAANLSTLLTEEQWNTHLNSANASFWSLVLGTGVYANTLYAVHKAVAVEVPEPSTIALLLMSVAGLYFLRSRKRSK